ncbi:MAG: type IV pilus assembly protein PilM, partial [Deltaproteobacteria bacterium]
MAAQNFFGLDIGTSSIKVVWLGKESQGIKLLAANSAPSPARGMLTESPTDQEALAQAIKKVQQDAKISTNKVVSALPESQIFTRVIDMPVLTDKELASAIRWEADQYLPVPVNEVSIAWQVLTRPEKVSPNSRMQVLLIAAPLGLVDKHIAILSKAGLKAVSLETENLAIVRALVDRNSPTSLILSLGAFTTDICIAKGGVLVSTRSIATAGNSLTRSISAELNFEAAQAEEYKKTYGLLEDQLDGKVFAAMRP